MTARTATPWVLLMMTVVALAGSAAAAASETDLFVVTGLLLDGDDEPIVGARVVFQEHEGTAVFLSKPSGVDGTFVVAVPHGMRVVPTAVIGANGGRVPLLDMPALEAKPGVDLNLRVMVPPASGSAWEPRPFPGADRLFLAFVEDTALVERFRFGNELRIDGYDGYDRWVSEFSAAGAFPSLPRLEFGGRIGYVGLDVASGGDTSGVSDLDAWARFDLGRMGGANGRYALGAIVTVPTGDEDDGLGAGALRSKLFAAGRWDLSLVTVAAHVGLRVNEDGEMFGVPLEGELAPAAGVAVIYPLYDRWVLVGEAAFEGERFTGGDPETTVLAGVNWDAFFGGTVRGAVGVGLTDGAADTQFRVAYAFDF